MVALFFEIYLFVDYFENIRYAFTNEQTQGSKKMSLNRENVIWQSKDQTWNRGFYTCNPMGSFDEDFDHEWDVEYDYSSFEWVSTGHPTLASAEKSWDGPNPDGNDEVPYKGNAAESKKCDLMAKWFKDPAAKEKFDKLEESRKNREHFKKLTEKFENENRCEGRRVFVTVKSDDAAHTRYGMSSQANGTLRQDGDWLIIGSEKTKVFNTKTNKFHKRIHNVEKETYSRW